MTKAYSKYEKNNVPGAVKAEKINKVWFILTNKVF